MRAVSAPPASFDQFPISEDVRDGIRGLGFTVPTDVQAAVIGPALAGRDLLVQSKTGSGKTCAFGIPMIAKLEAQSGAPGKPLGLILTPTRELAHQVAAELRGVAVKRGTRIVTVYGGVPIQKQVAALRGGVDIVVATPGRLLDHIGRKNMALDNIQMVVLDEADEMLSMGFWDDVTELLRLSPAGRQTMLFSATLPYQVAKAAAQFLQDPARIDVSGDDLNVAGINNSIYHVLPNVPKPRQMLYALEIARPDSAVIFCNTRSETDMLAKYLTQAGMVAEPLSGTLKQRDRERVMGRIKRGELRYMVATDIAARGIDINDLSHVFNYSLPEFSEVYLHRVGRTGRIGKVGSAISLVDGRGLGTLTQLEREFNVKVVELTLPPEDEILRARSTRIMKELAEKAAMAEISQHLPVAQGIIGDATAPQVVAFLLKSYFNSQADQARRDSLQSTPDREDDDAPVARSGRSPRGGRSAREPREPRAPRETRRTEAVPLGTAGEAGEVGEAGEASGEEGEGPRRRRRRRRRRGGSGTERAEGAPQAEGGAEAAPERSPRSGRAERSRLPDLDIVDAHDLLSISPTPPAATIVSVMTAPLSAAGSATVTAMSAAVAPPVAAVAELPAADGLTRVRVNIGFDDGFKGRGAVAKKISALAGINEGIIVEIEAKRDHAVLKATPEIAGLVLERVDGAQLGKKVITVVLSHT